jgi:hypothetical protein
LSTVIDRRWASRVADTRTIRFSRAGEDAFVAWFSGTSTAEGSRTDHVLDAMRA